MNRLLVILGIVALIGSAFMVIPEAGFERPEHFPAIAYPLHNNPVTPGGVELGRALFYDPVLSADSTVSCASCHNPYNAFAHTDHDLSHGIHDRIGTRNAPALFNLAWQSTFMWDGAINHLDMQALAPITDSAEMAQAVPVAVTRLNAQKRYRKLCFDAFGDSTVTGEHLLKSLTQFQLTLVSAGSKYDEVKQGKAEFTPQEANGYALFQQHCNSCHAEPLFSTYAFASNGLPIDTTLNDFGKGAITLKASDSLLFKIPSLRNLSFTFPYMHDGRFRHLSEVLAHYTSDLSGQKNLSPELSVPIGLTSYEKTDLLAFLLTLNDKDFVFDPKHQFPRKLLPDVGG